jgi:hypothetical protein
MSRTKRIPESTLAEYFDSFSRRYLMHGSPEAVDIELIGPDEIGDQVVASGARLLGLDYDRRTHTFEIQLESADRRVYDSDEVWVVEEPDGFIPSMEVVRRDGSRHVLTIKRIGQPRVSRPS